MEQELFTYLSSFGAVGIMCAILFNNVIKEKKEDRDLYRQSVDTFTEVSRQFAESIGGLSVRVENVEEGNNRIERKLDVILSKKEDE